MKLNLPVGPGSGSLLLTELELTRFLEILIGFQNLSAVFNRGEEEPEEVRRINLRQSVA